MAKSSRGQTDGLEVALAIHLGIYCAGAACFAGGLYALMQPTRQPNPGMAGYKPPSAMVVTYLPSIRNSGEPSPFTALAAETAKPGTAGRKAAEAQKPAQEARAEPPKRQRAATAPKERREPWARYAEQPTFGGNRPWF
jgi:hypothetical protein